MQATGEARRARGPEERNLTRGCRVRAVGVEEEDGDDAVWRGGDAGEVAGDPVVAASSDDGVGALSTGHQSGGGEDGAATGPPATRAAGG